ncbi:hypothetical protein ED733_006446 [Metarhizium rileyi]|uniref:Uncharacterized protein n=1 Tax=Metarhizium rileyi (strain RCEF 4871) TaxID=1649241 RepID=A0A5C6GD68_METRR|nr:hypothetical protein ED733_006446 [Metarhizium rileyi]
MRFSLALVAAFAAFSIAAPVTDGCEAPSVPSSSAKPAEASAALDTDTILNPGNVPGSKPLDGKKPADDNTNNKPDDKKPDDKKPDDKKPDDKKPDTKPKYYECKKYEDQRNWQAWMKCRNEQDLIKGSNV